jgi:hypothetical protein
MDGIFVHRITHFDNREDHLGSLLGSRTCPVGVVLSNLTLANVVVPSVSGVNQVRVLMVVPVACPSFVKVVQVSLVSKFVGVSLTRENLLIWVLQVSSLFALGTYGQQNSTYASDSPLDRWSFCANDWWLGCGNQVSRQLHSTMSTK